MKATGSEDSTFNTPTSVAALGFVDFPHPRSDRTNLRGSSVANGLMIAVVAGVALGVLFTSASPFTRNLVLVTLGIPGVLALAWLHKRVPREVREGVAAHGHEPLEELLFHLFPKQNAPVLQSLEALVRELAKTSRAGESCRICLPQKATPFEPIDQPFEPIPLDESDSNFAELEDLATKPGSGGPDLSNDAVDRQEGRRIRRNFVLSGGWLFVVAMGPYVLLQAWECWNAGRITARFVFFLALLCGPILGMGGRGAWTFWRKWLLIPGGVIVETAVMFGSATTKQPFIRSGSKLIVRQIKRGIWSAHVADAGRWASATITEREATMLLRAWLSPVPEETTRRLIAAAIG